MEPPRSAGRLRLRPNRNSLGLVFVLLAMAYAGASQSNAAAYLLGFLTFSLAVVSSLHARRNLRGLALAVEPPPPVFEGEPLPVSFTLRTSGGRPARALEVQSPAGGEPCPVPEVRPGEGQRGELVLLTPTRGRFASIPLVVASTFPLGFFTVRWQTAAPQSYYVYPRPEGDLPLPIDPRPSAASPAGPHPEGDDFAGVRDWRAGESMRHIDWKAAARGERLMVKQWSGSGAERISLDWALLPNLPTEARLRQLTRWVVQAARLDVAYEVRLPGQPATATARGEHHFHECLRLLARYVEPRPAAVATPGQTPAPPRSPRASDK